MNNFYNHEAEITLIGTILRREDVIAEAGAILKPDDFSINANGVIFGEMLEMYQKKIKIDILTGPRTRFEGTKVKTDACRARPSGTTSAPWTGCSRWAPTASSCTPCTWSSTPSWRTSGATASTSPWPWRTTSGSPRT